MDTQSKILLGIELTTTNPNTKDFIDRVLRELELAFGDSVVLKFVEKQVVPM